MKFLTVISYIILAAAGFTAAAGQPADSTLLREVEVTAVRPEVEVIPVQTLGGDELRRLNSHNVADAMRYFAGVQIKDYGGMGGIKTINVRSMGSHHTGVVYDGVELGNAQNGQIDLGQFSLDNIAEISLHNGQRSEILQPARDFGSAGTVYMRTRRPEFAPGERFHLRATARTGSFDLINVGAVAEVRLSNRVNASVSVDGLNSSGKYKFRYRRFNRLGEVAYDTTAVRHNGDICALRSEANVYGTLTAGYWSAKLYNYSSNRGVPSAIVNNVWRRGERLRDNNSFAQASWQSSWGRFATLCNLKYSFYNTHYLNNDSRQQKVDNRYRQHEFYFSTANQWRIMAFWNVALSYDLQFNSMWADLYNFHTPQRISNLLALASSLNFSRVKFQLSGLATFVDDRVEGRAPEPTKKVVTPAACLSVNPLRSTSDLSVRAFAKQSFRMPTFNDLYYTDAGNAALKPERVTQFDCGLLYSRTRAAGMLTAARFSADAYMNLVTDKIVAYPKGQQFRWTMLNLGKVEIRGLDLSGMLTLNPVGSLFVTLRGQYTLQKAIDVTDSGSTYYRDQIPYVPLHSGSAAVSVRYGRWELNYSYVYVGERWNQHENTDANHMRPWQTSDASLAADFALGKVGLRAMVEVNNLMGRDYDVILNYPMPRRNYRLTVAVSI